MSFALPHREPKPRRRGITAMIDFGPDTFGWTGPAGVADLIACAGDYIDYAKIYALQCAADAGGHGQRRSSAATPTPVSSPTAAAFCSSTPTRGTSSMACCRCSTASACARSNCRRTIVTLAHDERLGLIDRFQQRGFQVIYEFGRKNPDEPLPSPASASWWRRSARSTCRTSSSNRAKSTCWQGRAGALAEIARQPWFDKLLIETDPYRFPQQHAGHAGPPMVPTSTSPTCHAGQVLRLEGLRRGIGRAVNYRLLA